MESMKVTRYNNFIYKKPSAEAITEDAEAVYNYIRSKRKVS
jgi:hypothetical protein